jgi:hypothetical protein
VAAWLCRSTALHWASDTGHTETALALVKAGADVHCKNNKGYGSALGLHPCVGWVAMVRGGRSGHSGVELQECLFWLCRNTALHFASSNGHTETAMALAKAGADVHCKDSAGYGSSGCIVVSLGCHSVGADGPSTRGGAAGVRVLAVQDDGAAQSVVERPHGDGIGAGRDGDGDFFGGRAHSLP